MTATSAATRTKTIWDIDASHSHAEFAIRHMMISTVKGSFRAVFISCNRLPDRIHGRRPR